MLRKKLGDILVELNVLTPQQLASVLPEQQETGKLIGQVLLERGLVTKNDIARALAKQVGVAFVEKITEQMIDPVLLGKVPLKFLRQHCVIPLMYEGQKTIVTQNPRDLQPLDDLSLLMAGEVLYAVSTDDIINDAINRFYPLETSKEMMEELKEGGEVEELEFGAAPIEEKDIMEMANDAPIVKLVNHLLVQAVKEGASDIHIEPFERELRVRFRVDGNMYLRVTPPKRYQSAIVSRIKIMANLNIAEKRLPQDGRIQIKIADRPIDIRVSTLPTSFGECVAMRLFDKTKGILEIENLNLSEADYKVLTRIITRPNGIILVSGPTGSGKTTTLYAILNRLNQPDVAILTVEDPVEYTVHGINQVQVNEKAGLTFSTALRSFLRQDPDIMLIGEIRDPETAQIAAQASLTGHLVLSTIHTSSAPTTVTRLLDMGVESYLIASSLICVISQRLVRKLCDSCKEKYTPDAEMIKRLGLTVEEAAKIIFYRAKGCDDCLKMGYRGRLAIFEIMEIDERISKLIVQRADATVIRRKAIEQGMKLLSADGIRQIKAGTTTIEEVLTVAYAEEPLEIEVV
ncbi:MAG: type II secretion system ATPase GspE [Candidatus Babeliales bacterium]|jgi:general secretion pathway protein E